MDNQIPQLKDLGLEKIIEEKIKKRWHGIIIVSLEEAVYSLKVGYSIGKYLYKPGYIIYSIEKENTFKVEGIKQYTIENNQGFSYTDLIKNALRDDPDMILISEPQEKEDIDFILKASYSGHLIILTINNENLNQILEKIEKTTIEDLSNEYNIDLIIRKENINSIS